MIIYNVYLVITILLTTLTPCRVSNRHAMPCSEYNEPMNTFTWMQLLGKFAREFGEESVTTSDK